MRLLMAVMLVAALAACTTRKDIDTSVVIDAPPDEVYAVLTDFERYPEWNPYHIRVVGEPEVGADLEVRVSRPDGKVVDVPHVEVFEAVPGEALVWGGGIEGVFKGEHRFDLAETAEGGTRLSHTEVFAGAFIGFADLPVEVLTEGYARMNRALKAWIESGASGPAPE